MKVTVQAGSNSEKSKSAPEDWEVNHWTDTLAKAEEIKRDPKKMKHVKKHAKKQVIVYRSIQELRNHAKDMNESKEDPAEEASETPEQEAGEGDED